MKSVLSMIMDIHAIIHHRTYHTGLRGIPSGELFARLAAGGVDIETYNRLIQFMKDQAIIKEENYLLSSTIPDLEN